MFALALQGVLTPVTQLMVGGCMEMTTASLVPELVTVNSQVFWK